jgi:hypothetical protein
MPLWPLALDGGMHRILATTAYAAAAAAAAATAAVVMQAMVMALVQYGKRSL